MARVAVVGAGAFGRLHATKYAQLPCCRLSAIVDPVAERARALAAEFGVPAYADHARLIGRVDLVSIVTPAAMHHAIARDCLESHLDVLVEKPIAATREQAEELVALAQRHGRVLQIGHIERFNPAVMSVLERIEAPRELYFRRLAPFSERDTDVDVVLDLMIHDIDLALRLMRREVVAIHATGASTRSDHLDTVAARLDFGDGHCAHLLASRAADAGLRKLDLRYDDADLSIDLAGEQSAGCSGAPSDRRVSGDALLMQLASFLRCARLRRRPNIDGHQGLDALDVALRIRDTVPGASIRGWRREVH